MRDDSECGADTITYINCWALPETQTPTIDWKSCNSGITAVIEQQVNTTSALTSETSATIKEAGTYTARVTVTTSLGDRTSNDCVKQFTIQPETPKANPGIKIEKKVDGLKHKTVQVGNEFPYQVTVTNTGNVDLKNAVVTDNAPQGVTFLKASEGTLQNNTWKATIAELKQGLYAGTGLMLMDSVTIFRHWLNQCRYGQYEDGRVANIAPPNNRPGMISKMLAGSVGWGIYCKPLKLNIGFTTSIIFIVSFVASTISLMFLYACGASSRVFSVTWPRCRA